MNALIKAAAELQAVCVQHAWRFCFIGGLAVQRWGEPRETVDVDLTLLTGFTDESRYVSVLMDQFEARVADGVIIRQSQSLDWPYVRAQLQPLAELKEAPELVDRLERRRVDLQG